MLHDIQVAHKAHGPLDIHLLISLKSFTDNTYIAPGFQSAQSSEKSSERSFSVSSDKEHSSKSTPTRGPANGHSRRPLNRPRVVEVCIVNPALPSFLNCSMFILACLSILTAWWREIASKGRANEGNACRIYWCQCDFLVHQ
jgi:hypothetical protein